jgi:RimJ/RimL family protein N-acetyltransferase
MALWFDGTMVGYGGLVHINWFHERAELSFLVDPVRIANGSYERDFLTFLKLIARVAREDLALHRLTGETYPERTEHVRIFESFGFVCEGRLVQHRRVDGGYGDSLVHGLLLERVGT